MSDNFTDQEIERELMPTLSKADFDAIMPNLDMKLNKHRETATNDYASEDNVFSNFIEEGQRLGIDPKIVLGVYMDKHLTSIIRWMGGKQSQREPIQGRIEDAINYLKLAWAWAEVEGKINAKENSPYRQIDTKPIPENSRYGEPA